MESAATQPSVEALSYASQWSEHKFLRFTGVDVYTFAGVYAKYFKRNSGMDKPLGRARSAVERLMLSCAVL
jgi:hypothetical protein